jgi:hypothetical protein
MNKERFDYLCRQAESGNAAYGDYRFIGDNFRDLS